MMVLVDTSVWSLALRRGAPQAGPELRELAELLKEGRVVMIGPVRQELLSGIRADAQFSKLRDRLRAFEDIVLELADYEEAASLSNRCRRAGIQGGSVDFLICAVCLRRKMAAFTTDGDFRSYSRVVGLSLHEVRPELK